MTTEYGFNQLKLKQTSMKKWKLKYEKFEIQNYFLELQPDISIKVKSGMTDARKNYSNKYTCHFRSVCKLEEETIQNDLVRNYYSYEIVIYMP